MNLNKVALYLEYIAFCLRREAAVPKRKKRDEMETATPGFPKDERMAKWFEFGHLPEKLQAVSRPFHDLAVKVTQVCEPGPERTVALRKLLEAKDAAVRAALNPGG